MSSGNVAVGAAHASAQRVDSVTSAEMLSQLCTITPSRRSSTPTRSRETAGGTSRLTVTAVSEGAELRATRPLAWPGCCQHRPGADAAGAKRALEGSAMPLPFQAPHALQRSITPHRSLALTQLPLDDVKRIKNKITVQDQRRGAGSSPRALRTYLDNHGVCRTACWWRWCRCRCTAPTRPALVESGPAIPGQRHVHPVGRRRR